MTDETISTIRRAHADFTTAVDIAVRGAPDETSLKAAVATAKDAFVRAVNAALDDSITV